MMRFLLPFFRVKVKELGIDGGFEVVSTLLYFFLAYLEIKPQLEQFHIRNLEDFYIRSFLYISGQCSGYQQIISDYVSK